MAGGVVREFGTSSSSHACSTLTCRDGASVKVTEDYHCRHVSVSMTLSRSLLSFLRPSPLASRGLSSAASPGSSSSPPPANSVATKAADSDAATKAAWVGASVPRAGPRDVEVVHEATGQIYYWNQRTGQTTALGEPGPHEWKRGGSGGSGGSAGGAADAESQHVDPRAETPLPDKTGEYAAIGVVAGIFLGWASQFI
ncbi:hypothetical protein QJQ45_023915 [Haematococcus lacustris]|nr:hypothetical protein QJQ45_023915 [Haematococcus lacustris]